MSILSKEEMVLLYLKGANWTSPTTIGLKALGQGPANASSYASTTCKKLVQKGLVERNNKGHYRLKASAVNCQSSAPGWLDSQEFQSRVRRVQDALMKLRDKDAKRTPGVWEASENPLIGGYWVREASRTSEEHLHSVAEFCKQEDAEYIAACTAAMDALMMDAIAIVDTLAAAMKQGSNSNEPIN